MAFHRSKAISHLAWARRPICRSISQRITNRRRQSLFDSGQPLTPVGHEPKSREAEASNHGPLQQFEKLEQLHSASLAAQRQAVYSLARNKAFVREERFRKTAGYPTGALAERIVLPIGRPKPNRLLDAPPSSLVPRPSSPNFSAGQFGSRAAPRFQILHPVILSIG